MITSLLPYLPALILLIVCITQLAWRPLLASRIRYFFWTPVLLILTLLCYQTANQYFNWLTAGPPTSYLLPPVTPISYFIFYVGTRLWLPYLLSLSFAGLTYLGAKYLNKRYQERFFYPEEYYLIALGIFLSVHPLWIGFLSLTALAYVGYALVISIVKGGQARASFYYLWLPAALLVAILAPLLRALPMLAVLNI